MWGIFYLVAHGGILLIPNAIYWDDWILYRTDPNVILDTFRTVGSMFNWVGHQHVVMLAVGPWTYKALTFFLMFVTGLLLDLIIKRHAVITEETRFYIVLLFLVLPFNMARVALIDFGYTFCYFTFFLAWLLMERYRILALALFFLSFNTNSLLVFYAVPIIDVMYRGEYFSSLRAVLMFGVRRIDFILLPIVYFLIKTYYFSPSGLYDGYNKNYDIRNIIPSAQSQYENLFQIDWHIGLSFLFAVCCFFFLRKIRFSSIDKALNHWWLLAIGFLVFFLGAFPYWILGHIPAFHEWISRHQILLPLGSALVVVGALPLSNSSKRADVSSLISRAIPTFNILVISIIVGTSLAFNVSAYAALFVDWQKQQQLIDLFAKNRDVERGGLIIFVDRTPQLNFFGREQRFYEWNGLLEASFGNERRFGINQSQLNDYLAGNLDRYFRAEYKAGAFERNVAVPPVLVEIDLAKRGGFRENIINKAFPALTLSVSEIDLFQPRPQ